MEEENKVEMVNENDVDNINVKVIKKSMLKDTLLIVFNSTCFTLKANLARGILVKYA